MAHSNEYIYDIAEGDDEDILVEDLDNNQMGALNMIYINVEMQNKQQWLYKYIELEEGDNVENQRLET